MTAAQHDVQANDPPVAVLEAGLWRQLTEADDFSQFCSAWIALQCGMMAGATQGLIALGDDRPHIVAVWPEGADGTSTGMLAAAGLAIAQKRGVVQRADDMSLTGARCDLAYPLMIKDAVCGAAVISLRGDRDLRLATRNLQWGTAWLRERLVNKTAAEVEGRSQTSSLALELLAAALDGEGYLAASRAVATALAHKFGCERVSLGFLRRGRIHVAVISHSAQFGKTMNLVRLIGDAMDEAVDQRAAIFHPAASDEIHVTRAHANLAAQNTETVLTIPLMSHDRFVGAITFERNAPNTFSADEIAILDGVACALAPILEEKRRNDRWLVVKIGDAIGEQFTRIAGPGHWRRKIAVIAAAAVIAAGYWITDTYRISADAVIEGRIQRAVVASFNGFLKEAPVRAGDQVAEGQTLAALDDRDLVLERLRWVTERQRKVLEHEKALGERNRADVKIIATQIEQADAQIQLVDEHLARAKAVAPFDGLVVSGDLTQSIGAAVQRGQVLFEIAPLDSYRVMLDVDETQIGDVRLDQSGRLVVSSLPNEVFALSVAKITPVAKARDGHNFFRVEARLIDAAAQLRPGMRGTAKLDVEERRVAWIWTRAFVEWLQLFLWRWYG